MSARVNRRPVFNGRTVVPEPDGEAPGPKRALSRGKESELHKQGQRTTGHMLFL